MFRKAGAVVSHLNTKGAVSAFRLNFYEAGSGARRDAMANCILNDGLEDEVGDFRIKCLFRYVDAGDQAVLKSNAFDFKITTQESHLLFERYLLRTGVFQSEPQKVAQARDHLARCFRFLIQQCRD